MLKAMMCSQPMFVSQCTPTAIKVAKTQCGMVMNPNSTEETKKAIIQLKENKAFCNKLGMNGRIAYETIFSWHSLLNIYSMIQDRICYSRQLK